MTDEKGLKISNHAKERYVERILGKDDKSDIYKYIADHEDKILADISKMIEYGELLYTGSPVNKSIFNSNICDIYTRHNWIIIVDHESRVVITLYNIDLGLDKDFNLDYCEKMKAKISKLKEQAEEKHISNKKIIEQMNAEIAEYKKLIQYHNNESAKLTEDIKSLEKARDVYLQENRQFDTDIRNVIARFIGLKYF